MRAGGKYKVVRMSTLFCGVCVGLKLVGGETEDLRKYIEEEGENHQRRSRVDGKFHKNRWTNCFKKLTF